MNNVMLAANIWVAGECLLSLKKMGMDLAVAFEVLNAGSGRSFASESLLPPRLVEGEWPLAFKLALLDKDVRIAAETVHEQHLSTPVMDLVSNLYTAARRDLGENADYIEVLKYMAKMSGEGWGGQVRRRGCARASLNTPNAERRMQNDECRSGSADGSFSTFIDSAFCVLPISMCFRLSPLASRLPLDDNRPVSCYMTRRSARGDRVGVS